MQIKMLDHVNIVTSRLEEMTSWYETVLGLTSGPRPNFPFPGAWLYAGDTAFVHLVSHDGSPKVGSEVELKLEHFSFSASGREEFKARLEARGETFDTYELPDIDMVQFHVHDPDGNHIHIDFPMSE